MKQKPQLWVLAGANGAGKTTFYRTRLAVKGIPFLNADNLARQLYPESPESHSYEAADIAAKLRSRYLLEGRSFCYETVFSHPSKIDFMAEAKTRGYEIVLVFIHLDNAQLNKARVAQRVSEGGHTVPDEKIISRIPRTLINISKALPLCNDVYILDNANALDPFRKIASIHNDEVTIHVKPEPQWCKELLSNTQK